MAHDAASQRVKIVGTDAAVVADVAEEGLPQVGRVDAPGRKAPPAGHDVDARLLPPHLPRRPAARASALSFHDDQLARRDDGRADRRREPPKSRARPLALAARRRRWPA